MMRILVGGVLLTTILGVSVAVAAEKAAPVAAIAEKKEAAKPRVIFKKSESHQFSGASLKGQLKKPELSYIYERKGLKEEQIVNIPENFNDEIIKGAGQL